MENLEYVSFEELYSMNIEITDIYAERQKWIKGVLFSKGAPRSLNAIILLNGCNGVYTDLRGNGTSFFAPQNSVVCLPEGSDYSVLNNDCNLSDQDAYLIEFHIKKNGKSLSFAPAPFIINTMFPGGLSHAIKDVVRTYEMPIKSPISILSSVCEVLSILGKEKKSAKQKLFCNITRHKINRKRSVQRYIYGRDCRNMQNQQQCFQKKL